MLRKKGGLTVTRFFLKGVKFYQKYLSPLKPPSCRFYPTCSSYCYQAIEKYGVKKGVFFSIKRLLRCHPFCLGGYDPVD